VRSELDGDLSGLTGKDIEGLISLKKMGVARVARQGRSTGAQGAQAMHMDVLDLKRKLPSRG